MSWRLGSGLAGANISTAHAPPPPSRSQILAGLVEERGIESFFKGQHQLCAALSFVVRTGNTFLGSLLWVDFVRLLGMQKAGSDKKDH